MRQPSCPVAVDSDDLNRAWGILCVYASRLQIVEHRAEVYALAARLQEAFLVAEDCGGKPLSAPERSAADSLMAAHLRRIEAEQIHGDDGCGDAS